VASFLTGGMAGIGSGGTGSAASKALREIDSQKISYANKDFVKNIAWLNQSVDTLSSYTQKLEAGVTQANMNALEQLQGIWGDLFILFAGGEPTGIELGDIKYVIQGIGAFFGINPDTPFPLNLVEAATHMLTTYIIPLPQFTDVIFDSILLWAEDFGLSEDFIEAVTNFRDAIEGLGTSFEGFFDAIGELLGAFGLLEWTSTSGIGELWDALVDFIGGIGNLELLKPVLQLLANLGVPFINALTAIVNGGSTFLGFISGSQIRSLGDNVAPAASADTTVWSVGGSATTGWTFDGTVNATGTAPGSLTTIGNGIAKRVWTQTIYKATPGTKFVIGGKLRWLGIPLASNDIQLQLVWFNGETEVSTSHVSIPAGHGTTGGFVTVTSEDIVVPNNVDGFRIAAWVGTSINTGQVWVDDITVQRSGGIDVNLIDGLIDFIKQIPINAAKLIGLIPSHLFGGVPISTLIDTPQNVWVLGAFPPESVEGQNIWHLDTGITKSADGTGSVRTTADGSPKALRGIETPVHPRQRLEMTAQVQWQDFEGTGEPIQLHLALYKRTGTDEFGAPVYTETGYHEVAKFAPFSETGGWTEITGTYEVPNADVDMVRPRLYIDSSATAGLIRYDDVKGFLRNKILPEWVEGLLEELQDLLGRWHLLKDSVFNALTGSSAFLVEIADLVEALLNIPQVNILGWGGPGTLLEALEAFANAIVGGAVGVVDGVGAGLADIINVLNLVSQRASQGQNAWEVLGIRNNTSILSGLLKTSRSNRNLDKVTGNTSAVYFAATQSNTAVISDRVEVSQPLGVIRWIGYPGSGITELYINLWRVEEDGSKTLVHHSPNIVGQIDPTATSSSPKYMHYEIEPANRPAQVAGEEYFVQWVPVGGTLYLLADQEGSYTPVDTAATIEAFAFTRSETTPNAPASTLAKGSFTPVHTIPYGEFAIDLGDYSGHHDPLDLYVTEEGTRIVPDWVQHIDYVIVPAAGGGRAGATGGFYGESGEAGPFVAGTWHRGVDFSGSGVIVNIEKLGRGGDGGSLLDPFGKPGTETTISIPTATVTVPGCAGGVDLRFGLASVGKSPGTYEYKGMKCKAGGQQKVFGGNGAYPGGAGNGGNFALFQSGGKGAGAAVWLRFRQDTLDDEASEEDNQPPTPPTLISVVEKGSSFITVEAEGGTD